MESIDSKVRLLGAGAALSLCLLGGFAYGQETKAPEAPAKVEAPAAAAPAAAPAPKLPAYFSGSNEDPKKPAWPDATGAATGVWATPPAMARATCRISSNPLDLYDRIAHNLFSINYVWVLVAGFLVMFMQAGFMFVETGLCRAKNAAHTTAMNLMIYPLGCLAFWVYGFAHRLGQLVERSGAAGLVSVARPGSVGAEQRLGPRRSRRCRGTSHRASSSTASGHQRLLPRRRVDDVSVMALFFFMMVFMDTTATIPTGAMAERWAWKNFCLFGLWVALPYCLYANWVWGGGWLAQGGKNWGLGHGAVDFAGSGVVHAMGGHDRAGRRRSSSGRASASTSRRQAAGDPRPQHSDGRARHVHPGVRLVRLQSRLDAVRHRPAHQLRRREHDARQRHRRARDACSR